MRWEVWVLLVSSSEVRCLRGSGGASDRKPRSNPCVSTSSPTQVPSWIPVCFLVSPVSRVTGARLGLISIAAVNTMIHEQLGEDRVHLS